MNSFAHITVVLQGPRSGSNPALDDVLTSIHRHLPGAPIILATWRPEDAVDARVTKVVWLDDPGPLPSLKYDPPAANNVNRQIVSTAAGLKAVTTRFALKMRTDCVLTGSRFVDLAAAFPARVAADQLFERRVVASSFVTLNPRVIERIPFHLSDWFQFGLTTDLLSLWDQPLVSEDEATYFDRHAHDGRAIERNFRARYAVEQAVFLRCVRRRFAVRCAHLNDVRPDDLALFERVLASNVVLDRPEALGFAFPRKRHLARSWFYHFDCLNHLDWLNLYACHAGGKAPRFLARRWRAFTVAVVALVARFILTTLAAGDLGERVDHPPPKDAR